MALEEMALRKFWSEALRNKYLTPHYYKSAAYVICFSRAEKFLAISSTALAFSLVLSLVPRQEKEHSAP
jgi:hypothetical protein